MKSIRKSMTVRNIINNSIALLVLVALICIFLLAWGAPSGRAAITLVVSLSIAAGLLGIRRYLDIRKNSNHEVSERNSDFR